MKQAIFTILLIFPLVGLASCEKDSFTDSRDGQTYRTVQIGNQTWMAENLNYAYLQATSSEDSSSFCYKNSADSCAKYGRLYLWSAAMDSAGVFSRAGEGCGYHSECSAGTATVVRGVCPEGWHLPSKAEFKTLIAAVGGKDVAGIVLKSKSGWKSDGIGTDAYGFSALPAGGRGSYGGSYASFDFAGSYAYFWSATEDDSGIPYEMNLDYHNDSASPGYCNKYRGFSVRCLRDSRL